MLPYWPSRFIFKSGRGLTLFLILNKIWSIQEQLGFHLFSKVIVIVPELFQGNYQQHHSMNLFWIMTNSPEGKIFGPIISYPLEASWYYTSRCQLECRWGAVSLIYQLIIYLAYIKSHGVSGTWDYFFTVGKHNTLYQLNQRLLHYIICRGYVCKMWIIWVSVCKTKWKDSH